MEQSKKFAKHPEYRAIAIQVDVTDPASVLNMVDTAVKELRRIDCSVKECRGTSHL